jgi:large subunit ribosomal protein L9
MKIILKEEVQNLGAMGSVVKVKPGYARNFLIPQGMADIANQKNVAAFEHELRIIESRKAKLVDAAKSVAEKVEAAELSFIAKSGEEGKLFGSITSMDIADALAEKGIEIEKKKISIAEPIKRLGEHSVVVSMGHEIKATVTVTVTAEED